MRYAVVVEKAEHNHFAYVPDLPGCVATGKTVEEVEDEIRTAIQFHIEDFGKTACLSRSPSASLSILRLRPDKSLNGQGKV